jgi:DNA-binding transcriptional LysR family regulator
MLNEIDLSRTDLNLLVLFDAVLAEQHVGRAAQRLSLSPSAVSHGLGRLRRLFNDPLFLRSPKGMIPTDAALALAEPVGELLQRARGLIAGAAPFDPALSQRRFIIGAPDAVTLEVLLPVYCEIRRLAPGIDMGIRSLLPNRLSWENAFADLDTRAVDIAILLFNEVLPSVATLPARFVQRRLYDEVFVVAARRGHPFVDAPTLENYCLAHHVLSSSGDNFGYLDQVLADQGLSRRVALTVPNFLTALAVIAETDLLVAVPERFARHHGPRFNIVSMPAPMPLRPTQICAVVSKAAMADAGLNWLLGKLEQVAAVEAQEADNFD